MVNFQIPLEDDQYKAIGLLAASAAMIDSFVAQNIWNALQLKNLVDDRALRPGITQLAGRAITTHINASPRLNILATLIEEIPNNPDADDLRSLIRRARGIYDKRDRIVHAEWWFGEDGKPIAAKFNAKGEVKPQHTDITPGLLEQWAAEAKKLLDDFSGIDQRQRDRAFFSPSPGK
jgi:hypothetical protein